MSLVLLCHPAHAHMFAQFRVQKLVLQPTADALQSEPAQPLVPVKAMLAGALLLPQPLAIAEHVPGCWRR